jgi:hypothetical protein
MIQADIDGSNAQPPPGTPIPRGPTISIIPDPNYPDYFEFFQTRQDCENFNVYPPGDVSYVAQIACAPPFLDSPFGEFVDFGVKFVQNDAAIDNIGPSIPVLLTSGDHDGVDPPVDAQADYAYYQQHCGCDVTKLLLPDTAHLFMVHQSLPLWVNYVVDWLSAKGLPPARPTRPCPAPTTWCRSSADGCDLLCQWPHRQHRNRTCGRATAGPRPTLVMATCRRCDRSPVRRQIGSPVAHIHLSSLHDRRQKSALFRNVGPSSYRCGTSRESAHVSSERATPDGPRCPLPVRAASSRLARPRQQRTNDSAALR